MTTQSRFSRILSNILFSCLSDFACQITWTSSENTVTGTNFKFEKYAYHRLSLLEIKVRFRLYIIKTMQKSHFFNQTILWCRKLFHYTHYLSYLENYSDVLFINLFPVSSPSIGHFCLALKGPICTLPVQKCVLSWFTGILQNVWHWNILALIKRLWFLWIPIKLVKEICI